MTRPLWPFGLLLMALLLLAVRYGWIVGEPAWRSIP